MEKINNQIGKKVVSFNEAEDIGYVLDACFDEGVKAFEGYLICDSESEEEFFLPAKNIISENEECIFVESARSSEVVLNRETNNPIGKIVYDKQGVNLGKVQEVVLIKDKVDKLVTNKCEFKSRFIFSSGRDYIIFSRSKKTQATQYFDDKLAATSSKVKIMEEEQKQVSCPAKITLTPSMILNRTATADILGFNNELIIRKGEIITQNKLEIAKKHNKINFLIFNSK